MIDLSSIDDWIQVCEVDGNDLKFTEEYLKATKLSGCARSLASYLVAGWELKYASLLEYFGPDDAESDWYSGIDGEPMDVCEKIPEVLAKNNFPKEGFDAELFRDMFRAQLRSLKLPKKLIEQYQKQYLEKNNA